MFLTIGSEEADLMSPFDQFCRQLRNQGYLGLDVTVLKADGQVHETATFVNLPTCCAASTAPERSAAPAS